MGLADSKNVGKLHQIGDINFGSLRVALHYLSEEVIPNVGFYQRNTDNIDVWIVWNSSSLVSLIVQLGYGSQKFSVPMLELEGDLENSSTLNLNVIIPQILSLYRDKEFEVRLDDNEQDKLNIFQQCGGQDVSDHHMQDDVRLMISM